MAASSTARASIRRRWRPEGTHVVKLDGAQDIDRLKRFAGHETLQVVGVKWHLEDDAAGRGERLAMA